MPTNTNLIKSACYEQALVAILCEIKKKFENIDFICTSAKAGVIGNSLYSYIGTNHKVEVLKIIDEALIAAKDIAVIE